MATYELGLSNPAGEIVHSDVVLTIHRDGVKVGELRISRGTIDWFPATHQYRQSDESEPDTTGMDPGTEFGGYRVERLLGTGGFHRVYLAEDLRPALRRKVALKVLNPVLSADEKHRERFQRESLLAVELDDHPNIVGILDAGEHDGQLFIAQRYIDGHDLSMEIETKGPLSPERAAEVMEDIGAALDYAHEAGLVHRDVKPRNILIRERDQRCFLADFGLIKPMASSDPLTVVGEFEGTFAYAAPEQLEGKAVDGRADLYALGCVLFESLTGTPPFSGGIHSMITSHLTKSPPRAAETRLDVPAAIDDVVLRALAKNPADRYQTGAEFAAALHSVLPSSDPLLQPAGQPPAAPGIVSLDPSPSAAGPPRPALPIIGRDGGTKPPVTTTDTGNVPYEEMASAVEEARAMASHPSPVAPPGVMADAAPDIKVPCERGHSNDATARFCATCGVPLGFQTQLLALSEETGRLCPDGHFNPMGGGPLCVVCGRSIAAPVLDHDVQFTVYRPRAVRPQTWEQLLVFVHRSEFAEGEPDPVEEVRRQAAQVLGSDASRFRSSSQDAGLALPRGDELVLVPEVEGFEFNPPQRAFRWLREVHREEFEFITGLPDGTTAHGRLCVYLGAVLVGEVALSVPVSASTNVSHLGRPHAIEQARRYRRIFASYSHEDADVVDQVRTYATLTGDEFMQDVTHLRAGQDWNEALRNLIRQADLFQLFWSRNSMRSPEVRKEYEYALSLRRPEFIRPVYWQDPFPEEPTEDLPPGELRAIQFSVLPSSSGADELSAASAPAWRPEGFSSGASEPALRTSSVDLPEVGAEAGTEFGGYRIERLMGTDGFSTVCLAEDLRPALQRKVVLRIWPTTLSADEGARRRFTRNSLLAVEMDDHPHIAAVLDAAEHDGQFFIAERHIEGRNLRELLEEAGPIDPDRAVEIVTSIAEALDHAHQSGLIHNDVNSRNILIREGDRCAFLTNFELTERIHPSAKVTVAGEPLQDVTCVAPERFAGDVVDGRADLYALGCVLYETLTGGPPFGGDLLAVIRSHLSLAPPRVSDARPDLPGAIDDVVQKAMAKSPEERFQTGSEFAAALQA